MHLWAGDVVGETVQVVLRLYSSAAEVLYGFDCDCCCCAYNGREVLLTPRCYLALERMANVVNPLHAWPNRSSYEFRLAKYALRGFSIAVPGLDRNRADTNIYSKQFSELQGLARLLRINFEMERSSQSPQSLYAEPYETAGLREPAIEDLDPVRRLIMGANGFYDEEPSKVFVPSVFCEGDARAMAWYVDFGGFRENDFPPASQVRDPAWDEIENFGTEEVVDFVPNQLVDAWSDSSKSREFLNSKMDKDEVDNLYYMGAYKDPRVPTSGRSADDH